MQQKIHQINIKVQTPGQRGIPKRAVDQAEVGPRGLEGDYNRWRTEKGKDDLAQAVLLMPLEMLEQLNREGWPVRPGDLGENVTTWGLPYDSFKVGQRLRLGGEVEIEISKPCDPCSNLQVLEYVGASQTKAFIQTLTGRRGWYAAVVKGGRFSAGDPIVLL